MYRFRGGATAAHARKTFRARRPPGGTTGRATPYAQHVRHLRRRGGTSVRRDTISGHEHTKMKGSSEHAGHPAENPLPSTNALLGRLRRFRGEEEGYRWDGVPLKQYKNEGSHFRDITRQTLVTEEHGQPCELRYFEIERGGHSTFERHDHPHSVVILRGRGRAIVGGEMVDVGTFDLLHIPSQTWHQLQASDDEPLGFLCQVPCDRDRPTRPTAEEREAILAHARIGAIARL